MAQIIIGSAAIIEQNPTNAFQFVVSQMSGDGDAYDTATFDFDFANEQAAVNFGIMLDTIYKLQENGYCCEVSEVLTGLKQKLDATVFDAVFSKRKYPEDLISNILGRDVTCEGMPATLDGYDLFFYDDSGVKYHAKLVK